MANPMTEQTFQLPDKRTLAYSLYGPSYGQPVLYFHGSPSSRLELSLVNAFGIELEGLLIKYKLQLIAIDRPGMGRSIFNPTGSFTSFADDVHTLLQFLKIEKLSVLCWSGGGPFALSIANRYPGVIQSVNIIAGFTLSFSDPAVYKEMKMNKFYFGAAKKIPLVLRFLMNIFIRKGAGKPLPQRVSGLPEVDHSLLTDVTRFKTLSAATLQEACRQGSKGAVYEAQLYFNEFGFRLEEIRQPVHFWWGTEDVAVTQIHATAVEKRIPNVTMHYRKSEGHLSIFIKSIEETLQVISSV